MDDLLRKTITKVGMLKLQLTVTLVALMIPFSVFAESASQNLKGLGGNRDLILKAKELDPNNKVKVVQNRLVDRTNRLEFGLLLGTVAGGDSYLNTSNRGLRLDYHFTPRWSLGVSYYQSQNELTNEGRRAMSEAARARQNFENSLRPDVDFVRDTTLAQLNWYPIYGKLNLFNWAIAHFDIYALIGAGQVRLSQSQTETYTAGAGVGLWITQHISARFEGRYQTYQDQIITGRRTLDLAVFTAGLGVLF